MRNRDLVLVWLGDCEGYNVATLESLLNVEEEGKMERWILKTMEGIEVRRWVKDENEYEKDGCGYIIREPLEVFNWLEIENTLTEREVINLVDRSFKGKRMVYEEDGEIEEFRYLKIDDKNLFANGIYPLEACRLK